MQKCIAECEENQKAMDKLLALSVVRPVLIASLLSPFSSLADKYRKLAETEDLRTVSKEFNAELSETNFIYNIGRVKEILAKQENPTNPPKTKIGMILVYIP